MTCCGHVQGRTLQIYQQITKSLYYWRGPQLPGENVLKLLSPTPALCISAQNSHAPVSPDSGFQAMFACTAADHLITGFTPVIF